MPIISTTKMSAQQFLMLGEDPPGVKLELVNGEVAVSPSPTPNHSRLIVILSSILEQHTFARGLGEIYQDVDTILDRFEVRRPDILYYAKDRLQLVGEKAMEGPPDLAIEVISPSSVEIDREDKFVQYRDSGVAYYWIVDPTERSIESWALKDGVYVPQVSGRGQDVVQLPPFDDLSIPLERLWRTNPGRL